MISQVMRHCRNYFERESISGQFTIINGVIDVDYGAAQYIAINGSFANDGVHSTADVLTDETFTGRVWLLAPTADFLALCDEISSYDDKNPTGALMSESFGNYSYSRGGGNSNGSFGGWQTVFSNRLADYQLLSSEVMA